MSRFRRRGTQVRWTFDPDERALLRQLRDGLRAQLEAGAEGDPVVGRLFPSAVQGDDGADAELRRLIHDDLLSSKLRGLDALVELLDRAERRGGEFRVDLRDDEPMLVLGVVNDLRLALGARIGIESLNWDELDEDAPELPTLVVMDYLAAVQDRLLSLIDPPSVTINDGPAEPR